MPLAFTYEVHAPRVVFAAGALERLAARRVLLLCTPGRVAFIERVVAGIGERLSGVFPAARAQVPVEVVSGALADAVRLGADLCVALGGGSAIGLAKGVALRGGVPYLAIPTTYAGSEMTPIWGLTERGRKTTGRDARVLPRTVIYDPLLTLTLPASVTGPSGMNALAHCVEALYAPDANPVSGLLAEEGIRVLARCLPVAVRHPDDLDARAQVLYGAWLAGSSLAAVRMGLHHRICHVLGGSFGLPHAETHAVVLPHVVAFNADATERVAAALCTEAPAAALFDLVAALPCPTSLRELGLPEAELDRAAALVVERPYPNPRPASRHEVRALLADAFRGQRPA